MKTAFKRKLIVLLIAPALGLSIAGPASAAAGDRSDAASATGQTASAQDVRGSKLIGATVKNAQGETLGKIDDLVVDVNNDRVYYAVLASGGVMGLGGKLFAYPVSLFRQTADRDELVLNVDKERLKKAPGFERKSWPEWGQSQDRYRSEVDRYFGPTVTAKAMPNEKLARASTLIGKNVDDRDGHKAGEIKDLAVNLGTGRVHYAVFDTENNWIASDKLVPLSLHSFNYPADRGKNLVLNLAKTQIDMSKGFEEKRWKDMDINEPAFQRSVDSFLTAMSPEKSHTTGAAGRAGSKDVAPATVP